MDGMKDHPSHGSTTNDAKPIPVGIDRRQMTDNRTLLVKLIEQYGAMEYYFTLLGTIYIEFEQSAGADYRVLHQRV